MTGGLGSTLPPLQRTGTQRGLGAQRGVQPGNGPQAPAPMQMAPPAPSPAMRSKRFEAVGHLGRPPRFHVPKLGGPSGLGPTQPPIGATMGHGLIRHASLKDSYFFPPQTADLLLPVMRSTSEVSLGSARRAGGGLTPKGTPKGRPASTENSRHDKGAGNNDNEDDYQGGRMHPEMSPAYRNFRHLIEPSGARF